MLFARVAAFTLDATGPAMDDNTVTSTMAIRITVSQVNMGRRTSFMILILSPLEGA